MSKFYDEVMKVIRQDDRFFSEEGVLLKNALYEAAMHMDRNLLKLLLSSDVTKDHFFVMVDEVAVFDKVAFGWLINNREFFPDSYTRFKNKIGLTDSDGDLISASNI